ncbi:MULTISPECIES: DUF4435 domain-containing protein [unclassified Nodularia (in: cyanobacteria)]|uniref:DUF4435 domain-containing protein n=1 Tax=unclassified Nodularia (in: cyanobacteria) TaxID=2656917 RepID=UPI001882446F|nr:MULTISPECIES: DUF4435 domain-containing protein [unclassified Nodularia (in: cyanobacteria)]MBE9200859.1 DUF4435 domain-containing protein [Nodularia sp. LEGE 06071]MCC2692349.1 DUF4435 domain-containing protein [Nodularia sp. LEGE 04288]
MSVDNLRASRGKAVTVFVEFTRLYKQYESALYCFFEGEDSKYYGIRIKTITKPKKDIYLNCNGKEGVLGIYRMLSSRNHYANAKTAYFVDKDFDQSIDDMGINRIYETPGYSVENFYTSVQCFSEILKSEFKLTELDENFERCISLYEKLQEEFHNAVELLNAWIACHRDKSSRLNISDLSLLRLIQFDLNQVIAIYTIDDLHNKFPDIPVITQQELDAKKSELKVNTRQKSFRGKFEIEFLFAFLQKLINEANNGNYPYFTLKVKVVLLLTQRTIISDLSQYADTPDCLHHYLESLRLI